MTYTIGPTKIEYGQLNRGLQMQRRLLLFVYNVQDLTNKPERSDQEEQIHCQYRCTHRVSLDTEIIILILSFTVMGSFYID